MSINNIKLHDSALAALYSKSFLVKEEKKKTMPATAPEAPVTSASATLNFLGNNNKKITVVVNESDALHLSDSSLDLLTSILGACKLSFNDIAVLNLSKHAGTTYQYITEQMNAATVLLFGVSPAEISLPLHFPEYQIQKYNQQTYLYAANFNVLRTDKTEKTKLWNSLKIIFGL